MAPRDQLSPPSVGPQGSGSSAQRPLAFGPSRAGRDNAVGLAQRFSRRRGHTLVLVLADHECSGFSLIGALTGGIDGLNALPPDNGVTDPALQPVRQKVVGTYISSARGGGTTKSPGVVARPT